LLSIHNKFWMSVLHTQLARILVDLKTFDGV
jgi:hypothetical protein